VPIAIDVRVDPDRRRTYGIGAAAVVLLVVSLVARVSTYKLDFWIYYQAVASGRHASLYDFRYQPLDLGFTYPPFAALLFRPLTALAYGSAEHVWMVLSVTASAVFLKQVLDHVPALPAPPAVRGVLLGLGLFTFPVLLTLSLGQINALVALAVLADFVAVDRGKPWAGAWSGLAAAVKLTPAIAVVGFLAARNVRAVRNCAGAFLAATALAWVIYPADTRRYWTRVLFDTGRVGVPQEPANVSITHLAHHFLSGGAATACWLVGAVALVAVAFARSGRAWRVGNPVAAATIVMVAGALVSPITWGHHLYFLLAAVPLTIGDGRNRRRLVAGLVLAALLFEGSDPMVGSSLGPARTLALLAVVVAVPIDRGGREDPEVDSRRIEAIGTA
jgi:alpha-1,2-mannosyltransferase